MSLAPGPGGKPGVLARIGVIVASFAVFTAGWVAMKSDDWRVMVGVSALALVAGMIAAGLSRRR